MNRFLYILKRIHFHVTSGALVLILISFLFTITVYKINSNNIDRLNKTHASLCKSVSNANIVQSHVIQRIKDSIKRYREEAVIDRANAAANRMNAANSSDPTPSLIIARGWDKLAELNDQGIRDQKQQLRDIHPITLVGCNE